MSTLLYGDNLNIMRHMDGETVDLIYLDPPYNSKRDYNVTFGAVAQSKAFKDTWTWDAQDDQHLREIAELNPELGALLAALGAILSKRGLYPYLVNMAVRLLEMHRLLKPTGSIYLHVDPTASHYLKLVMDQIFGGGNFVNEITWKRSSAHNDSKRSISYGSIHDTILFYLKGKKKTWNRLFTPYSPEYIAKAYTKEDSRGRFKTSDLTANNPGYTYDWKGTLPSSGRFWAYPEHRMKELEADGRIYVASSGKPYLKNYAHEMEGIALQDLWTDINPPRGEEATGYPTQKPLALLERIVKASSNEGDVVLDPYMGSGTTIEAAAKHGRQWIGIDVTHHAIATTAYRLDELGITLGKDQVVGIPEDVASARKLKQDDPRQFDTWCVYQCGAKPADDGKHRALGIRLFPSIAKGKESIRRALYLSTVDDPPTTRDIKVALEKMKMHGAEIGFLFCFETPELPVVEELFRLKPFVDDHREIPKIQLITMRDLLHGNSGNKLVSPHRKKRLRSLNKQEELFDS